MTKCSKQNVWLNRVVKQICARDGVSAQEQDNDQLSLEIVHQGKHAVITLVIRGNDYALHKQQYNDLRNTLTAIGISEGAPYVPLPLTKRGLTPAIRRARLRHRAEFDEWRNVWKTIRLAENKLNVEFEIRQMMDYY